MRRAKTERVTDLVNFDRVRGFLRTIYWRRKFLAHREGQRRALNIHADGKPSVCPVAIVLIPQAFPRSSYSQHQRLHPRTKTSSHSATNLGISLHHRPRRAHRARRRSYGPSRSKMAVSRLRSRYRATLGHGNIHELAVSCRLTMPTVGVHLWQGRMSKPPCLSQWPIQYGVVSQLLRVA
jgi:hypothetical protein